MSSDTRYQFDEMEIQAAINAATSRLEELERKRGKLAWWQFYSRWDTGRRIEFVTSVLKQKQAEQKAHQPHGPGKAD